MFFEIFKFELRYRWKRPATYIYFAILALLSFFAVTTDSVQIGRTSGQVMENAPVVIFVDLRPWKLWKLGQTQSMFWPEMLTWNR